MKTIKKINKYAYSLSLLLGVVFSLCSAPQLQAQQDAQYTQYMYNTQTINPAYAGSRGILSITPLYRNQWVGLDGAPETLNLTLSTPLGESQRTGLGLSFTKETIGPADESIIAADFSYTLPLNDDENLRLAFGLKGGINLLNVNYSVLNIFDPSDELQQNDIDNRLQPIIGAGLFLHNDRSWYVGLSVPNLLETTHYDDSSVSNASERAALFATAGYVFDLSSNTRFKPAVLGKFVSGAPTSLDFSANFLFNEKFTLGAAYRLDAAISGLAAFQVSESILIGYAYDFGVQELANYNSGSHEIFLRFDILSTRRNRRILTPRFF